MNIEAEEFERVALSEGLTPQQAAALWQGLTAGSPKAPAKPVASQFDFVHLLYYFGAMMVMGAFAWFMTKAWDSFGGAVMGGVAVAYAIIFLLAGNSLWIRQLRVPGGLLIVLAVCMTPLAVYGVEEALGWWPKDNPGSYTNYHPYINGSWVVMEVATVLAGLLALRRWSFPFIVAPIAHSLWFMSMDFAELITKGNWSNWEDRLVISAVFGAIMILVGYLVDLKGRTADFAFWLYLFGLLALSGSFVCMADPQLNVLLYTLLHLGFIFVAIILQRRTFMVFGSLGMFDSLGTLARQYFAGTLAFPFVLCLFGLAVMALGIWYQRHRQSIESRFRLALLPTFSAWLPERVR